MNHLEEEIYRMLLRNISAMSQDRVEFHRMCDDVRAELDWIDPVPPFDPEAIRLGERPGSAQAVRGILPTSSATAHTEPLGLCRRL